MLWISVIVKDANVTSAAFATLQCHLTPFEVSCRTSKKPRRRRLPYCRSAIIAGDFNSLPSDALLEIGLRAEFLGPTSESHSLDWVSSSESLYRHGFTIDSVVCTKHRTVVVVTSDFILHIGCHTRTNDRINYVSGLRIPQDHFTGR